MSIDSNQLITNCEFSPDGKKVVIAYTNSSAAIWDVQSKKMICSINVNNLGFYIAKFDPAGTHIIINLLEKN